MGFFAGFVSRTFDGVSPDILLPRSTPSSHIIAKSSSGFGIIVYALISFFRSLRFGISTFFSVLNVED